MLKIVGLDGKQPDRSFVWIPSIKAVVGGVVLFNNLHVWMADTQSAQSHADWLATLKAIDALKPKQVVPGHYLAGPSTASQAAKFTADYIRAFDAQTAKAKDSAELIAAMKKLLPERGAGVVARTQREGREGGNEVVSTPPDMRLHYVYDPLCGWCYAAAPLVKVAREVMPVVGHAGGMLAGPRRRRITDDWRDHVLPHDRRIADAQRPAVRHGLLRRPAARPRCGARFSAADGSGAGCRRSSADAASTCWPASRLRTMSKGAASPSARC